MLLGIATQAVTSIWAHIFEDDAYYYSIVARNLVETGRLTFDGIGLTNGFHPLFFLVELANVVLLGPDASPLQSYRWMVIVSAFILIGSTVVLWRLLRSLAGEEAHQLFATVIAAATALVFVGEDGAQVFCGMESTIAFPLLVLTVVLLYRNQYSLAGITGCLMVAARLDTLVYILSPMALVFGLYEWRQSGAWRTMIKTGLQVLAPTTAFMVLYLVFNQLLLGHPMPIHGTLKSTFPHLNVQWHHVFLLTNWRIEPLIYRPFQSLVLACAGAALILWRRPKPRLLLALGGALVFATMCQLSGYLLFQKWAKEIPSWYQPFPLFTGSAAMALGVASLFRRSYWRIACSLTILVFLTINVYTLTMAGERALREPSVPYLGARGEIVEFMRTTAEQSLWAYTDCGRLAFWGDRTFVNLDGLINNFEYQEYLREGRLWEYLDIMGVRYLVAGVWDRPQRRHSRNEPMYQYRVAPEVVAGDYETLEFYVYSYLYNKFSDRLLLPKEAEVARSSKYPDFNSVARLIVYDLDIVRARRIRPTANGVSLTPGSPR